MKINISLFVMVKNMVANSGSSISQEMAEKCIEKVMAETGWPRDLAEKEFQKLLDLMKITIQQRFDFYPNHVISGL